MLYRSVHKVLESKRSCEEILKRAAAHKDICVVVNRADSAGSHKDVFSLMHKLETLSRIGLSLNLSDASIVRLSPSKTILTIEAV